MSTALKLQFVIVGSGPAGLCAALALAEYGHDITVLEAKDQLTMLGAGLTLQPSATKALQRFGLGDWLKERGVQNKGLIYLRYTNGAILGTDTTGNVEQYYDAPSYAVHRGHFVKELYNLAIKRDNISIRFNAPVVNVVCGSDSSDPVVTLSDGETIAGDIVIGADGIKSVIRPVVTGQSDRASDTGDSAYRSVIPTSLMLKDPDLASFVEEPYVRVWLSPERHLVAYNISAMKEFNIVMLHESKVHTVESWTLRGDPDKMRAVYSDFEPRVQKLLALVESTYLWKLMDRPPISNWVHDLGKVVVIGDACHPILPYRAQGAGIAVEDADALGAIFSHISSKEEIKEFMLAFQSLRAQRCADAMIGARMSQKFYRTPDGPEQEARDARLKNPSEHDKHRFQSFYRYDTRSEVSKWWEGRKSKAQ